jgi:hypothetical protein
METRCGSCNKLFRIPDDKITGKGIKFACTKCGGMVKITREEFEAYTVSKTEVPAPVLTETPPVPDIPAPTELQSAAPVEPSPSVPDFHADLSEPTPRIAEPALPKAPEPKPAAAPKPDSAHPVASHHEAPAVPAPTHREPVHHAPRSTGRIAPSRSRGVLPLVLIIFVILGIAGYGVYFYYFSGTTAQKTEEQPMSVSSTEGLQIASATGAMEPTGDLVITTVIENSLSVERTAWYVVVDVMGTQGALLSRIRVVNGKQLFTQRDYDIMASRGMNVQELKAKNLEDQGIVLLPHGNVTFDVRYIQPTGGIASFNATVQPYDPARMFKEISGEIK